MGTPNNTVNKKEFAYKIAEEGGFYKKDAVKMVELFWETLMDYLSEGKKVNFYGLGHFELKTSRGKQQGTRKPEKRVLCRSIRK